METSPLHSIYIPVPNSLKTHIIKLHKKLDSKYENIYPNSQNFNPHIDILTIRVKEEKSEAYVLAVKQFHEKFIKPNLDFIKISLNKFTTDSKKQYLFLNFDKNTAKQLKKIRQRYKEISEKYRDKSIPPYLKRHWDEFTKTQRERIRKTGSTHKYRPHITIIKLPPNQLKTFLKKPVNQFKNQRFYANQLHISKEIRENGQSRHEIRAQLIVS
jgi:2'-5' RNA ligase